MLNKFTITPKRYSKVQLRNESVRTPFQLGSFGPILSGTLGGVDYA